MGSTSALGGEPEPSGPFINAPIPGERLRVEHSGWVNSPRSALLFSCPKDLGRLSRPGRPACLLGMSTRHRSTWRWLAILVLAHLVVSIVHGMAHVDANVPLTLPQIAFVVIVILAGPLVGLAMTWPSPRIGGWLIALTMAASLVFGVVNHFVVESPDHVAQVTGESSTLFAATAVLIVVTEALGTAVAILFVKQQTPARINRQFSAPH
jgi:hypothetical protein